MSTYREHCQEARELGVKPLSMKEWAESRKDVPVPEGEGLDPKPAPVENDPLDEADAETIQNVAAVAVAEPEDEPTEMTFWHDSANHVEIMQAGGKILVGHETVVRPHIQIEFIENRWTADLLDPLDRQKAEWLMQCKEWRAGKILPYDEIVHGNRRRVEVREGPRTTGHNSPKINPRPAGDLSAPIN